MVDDSSTPPCETAARRDPSSQPPLGWPGRGGHCLNLDRGHARYLAGHLPDARLVTPGGTDSLWFTDTDAILDETLAFLGSDTGRS